MKKELGILLLAFITSVGFSGAIAAAPPGNDNNNIPGMNNHGNNQGNMGMGPGWTMIWSGNMKDWRHTWWWRHHFRGNDFFFRGHHFKTQFRHDRFGHVIIVIVRR